MRMCEDTIGRSGVRLRCFPWPYFANDLISRFIALLSLSDARQQLLYGTGDWGPYHNGTILGDVGELILREFAATGPSISSAGTTTPGVALLSTRDRNAGIPPAVRSPLY